MIRKILLLGALIVTSVHAAEDQLKIFVTNGLKHKTYVLLISGKVRAGGSCIDQGGMHAFDVTWDVKNKRQHDINMSLRTEYIFGMHNADYSLSPADLTTLQKTGKLYLILEADEQNKRILIKNEKSPEEEQKKIGAIPGGIQVQSAELIQCRADLKKANDEIAAQAVQIKALRDELRKCKTALAEYEPGA